MEKSTEYYIRLRDEHGEQLAVVRAVSVVLHGDILILKLEDGGETFINMRAMRGVFDVTGWNDEVERGLKDQ